MVGSENEQHLTGFDAMEDEDRQIWLDNQHDDLLDVTDSSILYPDFPPLPDFPCMSSSSSSSSSTTPAPAKPPNCSSSSSSVSSSSSAASWAVLKSDAEEDEKRRKNYCGTFDTPALVLAPATELSSTASMEMDLGVTDVDCLDVMEDFGYLDLLENNDFFDPSSIFSNETASGFEEFQGEKPPFHEAVLEQPPLAPPSVAAEMGSDDLGTVFFEWLKVNKDSISAEDLRKVKIKKSTIECAAQRLGGGKEAMKQLLKLILEWVKNNHLQRRRFKEASIQEPFQNPNPNPNLPCNNSVPESTSCFPQSPWIPPPQYPPVAAGFPPVAAGFPPVVPAPYPGDPFPYPPPVDYQMLDSSQSWPSSQFAMTPSYNSFPDPPPCPQGFSGYSTYPYQCFNGNGNGDNKLVRFGSSATKEARKKRMARQRRFLSHHHRNQNQNQQHQIQCADQHVQNQANTGGTWVYWPSGPVGAAVPAPNPPPLMPMEPPQPPPVNRVPIQQSTYQRQIALERRQGWKPEKNLRFLLQKVLKQSDVGNLGRIVLPKKEAETHLPELEARDGISIAMEDIGTSRIWNMRYRFWPNNKSRMYLLENTGDFVRTNGLEEGDFIVIYSDIKCGKYLIRGVKVRNPGPKSETKRGGKSQRNQNANSAAAAGNCSSSAITQQ